MVDGPTETYATRLRADDAARVEEALEETDQIPAELVERAIQYYIEQNPDDIPAFHPEGSFERKLAEDLR